MCDGFSEAFAASAAAASASSASAAGAAAATTAAAAATTTAAATTATTMGAIGSALGTAAGTVSAASGTIGAVAAVGSAALSGYQMYQSSEAQKASNTYNAQVANNNAAIALQNRSIALQQDQQQQEQAQLHAAQMLGEQKAALGANGVDLNTGSALDLQATTHFISSQDVANIQTDAARKAWGYEVEAGNYAGSSNLNTWQSANNNPTLNAAMAGGGSLLNSASMYAAVNTRQNNSLFGGK